MGALRYMSPVDRQDGVLKAEFSCEMRRKVVKILIQNRFERHDIFNDAD